MIDLHSHILPSVDDGSRNMQETIELLKRAQKAGFDTICFTPHYAEPQYLNSKEQNYEILRRVETKLKEEDILIRLLLGNEVFIHEDMENSLQNNKIATLADTHYVLIELPMYQELTQEVVQKMLNSVKEKGLKIVIAHPERYTYIQERPEKLMQYFGEDIIFQGNYASIIQKTIKKLFKNKQIHYLSSDVHRINRCIYDEFDEIKKKLLKVVDYDYFKIMTKINPRLIIEDKEIKKEIENGKK